MPDRCMPPDAETFRLEAIDTGGMGINAKDIPRLFSDFPQLETTRKSTSQGAAPRSPARRGLCTERHTNTDFVGALAYGVCHDAVETKAHRSIDPTATR